MLKRLGIFCMHDSEGIVDDYIIYLLQEMKKILAHLSIVCNGELTPESQIKLEKITDDILIRENSGLDVEAWRQAILQKNLSDYDELILFNDTFFGPLYPLAEVFDEMDRREPNADFWGLTVHGETLDTIGFSPYGYIPEYIQPYFFVIRQKMLHSQKFLDYWTVEEENPDDERVILRRRFCFTKFFYHNGFDYAIFCDTRALEREYDLNIDQDVINAEKLIRDYKLPILRRKVFFTDRKDYVKENYGDIPRHTLNFVQASTNYDVNLIWENLLRTQNITLLKENLGLNYILTNKFSPEVDKKILENTVIIAHLYYDDLIPQCVKFLCNAPPEISIIVTTSSEQKKLTVEKLFDAAKRKVEVRLIPARGRDVAALLVSCADAFKKYKYLCFVHDKKSMRPNESMVIGEAFFKILWENNLGGTNFIKNILATFENEPRLGLLVPPRPYNGGYKILFFQEKYWSTTCFDKTLELAEELGISKNFFSKDYAPLSIGSAFWCRTESLKKLTDKNWTVEDFDPEPMPPDGTISHALERIFPFAAQAAGFYTGQVINSEFAKDELENFLSLVKEQKIVPVDAEGLNLSDLKNPAAQLIFEQFQNLTSLQILKFFLQSRIPPSLWIFFKPFKNLLKKLGFNI